MKKQKQQSKTPTLHSTSRNGRPPKLSLAQRVAVLVLLQTGASQTSISKMFNVSHMTICNVRSSSRYVDQQARYVFERLVWPPHLSKDNKVKLHPSFFERLS